MAIRRLKVNEVTDARVLTITIDRSQMPTAPFLHRSRLAVLVPTWARPLRKGEVQSRRLSPPSKATAILTLRSLIPMVPSNYLWISSFPVRRAIHRGKARLKEGAQTAMSPRQQGSYDGLGFGSGDGSAIVIR